MFILNIPEPCHQNWNEMQPKTKGRFCGSCQKIVVDFTQMSDEQVKNYLFDNKHKNTCGRFKTTQLDRPLENQTLHINATWYGELPFAKQVFYAVAVFFFLGVSSCDLKNDTAVKTELSTKQDSVPIQNLGAPILSKTDTLLPPKTEIINHPGPVLNTKLEVGEPLLYQDNVTQGAPLWVEPIDTNSRPTTMVGKIAAPVQVDTVAEPIIMGDIAMPIQQSGNVEDKKNHAK